MKLEIAAHQLEILGNPIRLKLYRAWCGRAGRLPVGTCRPSSISPASTLSHHIRHLKEAGLITQERQATTLICRASYPRDERPGRLSGQ